MAINEDSFISRVAIRQSVSTDTVRTILNALRSGGGRMAQFSHPDFGGMSQWSPGMTMVGDMFNDRLKSKLNDICVELVDYLAAQPVTPPVDNSTEEISYRASSQRRGWWPGHLGSPSSAGSQNSLRYAIFPQARRLAIADGDRIDLYDIGRHQIFGIAQAQSLDQTLSFTSDAGLVRIADLNRVAK